MGMVWFGYYFGTECGTIIFVVGTSTTISSSLGRQYGPVPCLSFLDVYETTKHLFLWKQFYLFCIAQGNQDK